MKNNKGYGVIELIFILIFIVALLTILFGKMEVDAAESTPFTAGIIKVVVPNICDLSIEEESIEEVRELVTVSVEPEQYTYNRTILTKNMGVIYGPSGKETWYNLPMNHCVYYMKLLGYDYSYWVRNDGVKMYGDYIMIAADTRYRPKGTIISTSLGSGMVCDHCEAAETTWNQIDIAVAW